MAALPSLCTVADLETLIQTPIPSADADSAQQALDLASAVIRAYCGQVLTRVTAETVACTSRWGRILLPELPVVAVTAVTVAGTPLEVGAWTFEPRTGELVSLDATETPPTTPLAWADGYRSVLVTYDHGWSPPPADLVVLCARVASRQYLGGLRSALVGPHARESDFAAVFQQEPPGEVAGAYGPTSAVILTGDEKAQLNRTYRVLALG